MTPSRAEYGIRMTGESLSFFIINDKKGYEIVPYMVSIRKNKMVKYSKTLERRR